MKATVWTVHVEDEAYDGMVETYLVSAKTIGEASLKAVAKYMRQHKDRMKGERPHRPFTRRAELMGELD